MLVIALLLVLLGYQAYLPNTQLHKMIFSSSKPAKICQNGFESDGLGGCKRQVDNLCEQGFEPNGKGGCKPVTVECQTGYKSDGKGGCEQVAVVCKGD